MPKILTQKYTADLAEKCRKALEVSFGEIPMPKNYTKSVPVISKPTKNKPTKNKPTKNKPTKRRKIVIKRKKIKNIGNSKLPVFF